MEIIGRYIGMCNGGFGGGGIIYELGEICTAKISGPNSTNYYGFGKRRFPHPPLRPPPWHFKSRTRSSAFPRPINRAAFSSYKR